MKLSMKIFIVSSALSFLLSSIGIVMLVSFASEEENIAVTGSAPGELSFEGSTFQYYDIYAEDAEISIELGNFSYDSRYTYVKMCTVENEQVPACGSMKGSQTFVGTLTVGGGDNGIIVLNLEGSGEVSIVETSVGSIAGIMLLLCGGCCFFPLLVLISAIKAFSGDSEKQVVVVEQDSETEQSEPEDDVLESHKTNFPTNAQK